MADPIQPRIIWLEPVCAGCERHFLATASGRTWCTDPQDDCPECGMGWTRYLLDESQAATALATPPTGPGA